MNAFLVVPGEKLMRNQNDNLNPNKKSRGNLDDDNMTSLPNLQMQKQLCPQAIV